MIRLRRVIRKWITGIARSNTARANGPHRAHGFRNSLRNGQPARTGVRARLVFRLSDYCQAR